MTPNPPAYTGCSISGATLAGLAPVKRTVGRRMSRLLIAGLLLLSLDFTWAASFDCTKAASSVERLICSTPALSALDEEVADLYSTQLALASSQPSLRDSQRAWLRTRDACQDFECIRTSYEARAVGLACSDSPAMGSAIGVASCAKARLRALDRRLDAENPAGDAHITAWRAVRRESCLQAGHAAGGAPGWQAASALQCEVKATETRLANLRRTRGR